MVPTSINIPSKDDPTNTSSPLRRQVCFGTISIRRYDICPGDSPSCKRGVPLSLDWTFEEHSPIDLWTYDRMRPTVASLNTTKQDRLNELLLSEAERWQFLRNAGFSAETLKKSLSSRHLADRKMLDIRSRVLQERESRLKGLVGGEGEEEAASTSSNMPELEKWHGTKSAAAKPLLVFPKLNIRKLIGASA